MKQFGSEFEFRKELILLYRTMERILFNKPKAKWTRQIISSETVMTVVVEWRRREACSKPRDHSYFITKVFRRKETETKINPDLGVFYELLNEALCGKCFRLSVCLSMARYQQHNGLHRCNQIQYKRFPLTVVDQVWPSSKLSQ